MKSGASGGGADFAIFQVPTVPQRDAADRWRHDAARSCVRVNVRGIRGGDEEHGGVDLWQRARSRVDTGLSEREEVQVSESPSAELLACSGAGRNCAENQGAEWSSEVGCGFCGQCRVEARYAGKRDGGFGWIPVHSLVQGSRTVRSAGSGNLRIDRGSAIETVVEDPSAAYPEREPGKRVGGAVMPSLRPTVGVANVAKGKVDRTAVLGV